jgi:hypothetical protein
VLFGKRNLRVCRDDPTPPSSENGTNIKSRRPAFGPNSDGDKGIAFRAFTNLSTKVRHSFIDCFTKWKRKRQGHRPWTRDQYAAQKYPPRKRDAGEESRLIVGIHRLAWCDFKLESKAPKHSFGLRDGRGSTAVKRFLDKPVQGFGL